MKKRYIYTIGIVFLVIFVIIFLVGQITSSETQDEIWVNFCRDKGFLSDKKGFGADDYFRAISVLSENKVKNLTDDKFPSDSPELIVDDPNIHRFSNLIIQGAQKKKFGKEVKGSVASQIYLSNGKKFPINKVRFLAETLSQLAETRIKQGNIQRAVLLGTVNIAMGTQLSYFDDPAVHMYGVACKSFGLKTLKKCTARQENNALMTDIENMSNVLDKELQEVKKSIASSDIIF